MNVLVAGGTGFVGHALVRHLLLEGHGVTALVRDPVRARRALPLPVRFHRWDAACDPVPPEALAGSEAVVNLAGEPIGPGRWSAERRRRLRETRVGATARLMEALAVAPGVRVVVSASAVGYYGDRGEAELGEAEPPGQGFLADLCRDWERACLAPAVPAAAPAGPPTAVRCVALRIGMVLGRGGGALGVLLPLFRGGLGGPLGRGRQWLSWIHLADLVRLIAAALAEPGWRGAVNAVAPDPVRQAEFARALGAAVHRPALLPAPAFAVRAAAGDFAESVLSSQRVLPRAALAAGFRFAHPALRPALDELCDAAEPGLERFHADLWLPRGVGEVFRFFAEPANFGRIMPPWLGFEQAGAPPPELHEGALLDYRLRLYGVPVRWQSRIEAWEPGRRFVDVQTRGPFALWHHTHLFRPLQDGTLVSDDVRYRLPGGPLARGVAGWKARADLRRVFEHRRRRVEELLAQ
ncbi:MAG: TIGR01777 family protein [Candidatus Lambdaproteobacteria bacterium]|nr:TIGR01777 family protein [Candidatus Lambdaproteobacteria bacterium]